MRTVIQMLKMMTHVKELRLHFIFLNVEVRAMRMAVRMGELILTTLLRDTELPPYNTFERI